MNVDLGALIQKHIKEGKIDEKGLKEEIKRLMEKSFNAAYEVGSSGYSDTRKYGYFSHYFETNWM